MNWGSSSMEVLRMRLPMRVRRGSFLVVQPGPCASASWRIERNLSILNGLASSPMRSWTKNTGPGESSLMAMAVSIMMGEANSRKMLLSMMSTPRLRVSFQPRSATSRMVSSGRPPRSLMVTSDAIIWNTSGKTRMLTFSRSAWEMMPTSSSCVASGRPMMTSPISWFSMMWGRSSMAPRTGNPITCCAPELESTKPMTV